MNRILITGASGYIGAAVAGFLTDEGFTVEGVDRKAGQDYQGQDYQGQDYQGQDYQGQDYQGQDYQGQDYRMISDDGLRAIETIIHLAGHSSVAECEADPRGAVANNLTDFIDFVGRLKALEKPPLLLWASSGSVLSTGTVPTIYDGTKRALEAIVPLIYPRSVGLRFGTVCGPSANMRDDLMLNAMVKSAVETGVVRVRNREIMRPILATGDLLTHVLYILRHSALLPPGAIHNMSSFTTSPIVSGLCVAKATGAEVEVLPDSSAYDFVMDPDNAAIWDLPDLVNELVEFYRGGLAVRRL